MINQIPPNRANRLKMGVKKRKKRAKNAVNEK